MKKIISILLFLLCLVCTADAQNFAPGEQAQGLLGHLSLFGLVNMNARLYDPELGRFLFQIAL